MITDEGAKNITSGLETLTKLNHLHLYFGQ